MNDKKIHFVIPPKGYGKCYKEYKEVIDYLENKIKKLLNKNEKLQSNWNSLREWLENKVNNFQDGVSTPILHEQIVCSLILDKMNELEGVDNDKNIK